MTIRSCSGMCQKAAATYSRPQASTHSIVSWPLRTACLPQTCRRMALLTERASAENRAPNRTWRAIAFSGLMPIKASVIRATRSWVCWVCRRPALRDMRITGLRTELMKPLTSREIAPSCHDTSRVRIAQTIACAKYAIIVAAAAYASAARAASLLTALANRPTGWRAK